MATNFAKLPELLRRNWARPLTASTGCYAAKWITGSVTARTVTKPRARIGTVARSFRCACGFVRVERGDAADLMTEIFALTCGR